ncbi:MAG: 50S ribosomal protein L6 [Candidatus Micrarchaeota archaeon]
MMIPEGVTVDINGNTITVKGPKGHVERTFSKLVSITKNENEVEVAAKTKMLIGTWDSHVKNMFIGVTLGYSIQLKVIHAHFPMSIKVNGKKISIENFLGEKQPRKAKIAGDAKVEVKGQIVTLSGANKEDVGNTYTSLKQATKIKMKDGRVFQDGLYKVQ